MLTWKVCIKVEIYIDIYIYNCLLMGIFLILHFLNYFKCGFLRMIMFIDIELFMISNEKCDVEFIFTVGLLMLWLKGLKS